MVKAKFKCMEVNHAHVQAEGECAATIKLIPVWSNEDGSNSEWSKHTPSGSLTMVITNPKAIDQFELGCDYELSFKKLNETG